MPGKEPRPGSGRTCSWLSLSSPDSKPAGSKSAPAEGLIRAPPVILSLSSSDIDISSVGFGRVMPLWMFRKGAVLKPDDTACMLFWNGLWETVGKAANLGLSELLTRFGACRLRWLSPRRGTRSCCEDGEVYCVGSSCLRRSARRESRYLSCSPWNRFAASTLVYSTAYCC